MTEKFAINLIFALFSIIILATWFSVSPYYIADFDSYVILTDYLSFRPFSEWIAYEPMSSITLLLFRRMTGNSYDAVVVSHWYLSAVFLLGFYRLMAGLRINWHAIVVIFGLYGALLAFVTVRATPAYILVCLAVVQASRGRPVAILLCLGGALFHISAIMALPPIALSVVQNRFFVVQRLFNSRYFAIFVAVVSLFIFVLFFENFINLFLDIIGRFSGVVGKYLVYLANADGTSAVVETDGKRFHFYYLIGCSTLVIAFILQNDDMCKRLRGYVVLSFAIFTFLGFSPVSAFRQSMYWVIPILMFLPWHRFALKGFGSVAIVVVSGAMFAFNLSQVIE